MQKQSWLPYKLHRIKIGRVERLPEKTDLNELTIFYQADS